MCSKCRKPAVVFIRYNGTHLCQEHFLYYVEKRVKKEIKLGGKTKNNTTIGVAVSGGKDSILCLYLLHKVFSQRPHISLICLTVDEGIKGYRNQSIEVVKKHCTHLGVEHQIISFKDTFGSTMDEIAVLKQDLGECSFCGVFRRFCLNTLSKQLGVTRLATGHNLDDMAQSILMNFTNGDMQKLARLGPHTKIQPGLVPRLMPLRWIPEKETTLYCLLEGIDFAHEQCPYAFRALRGEFRSIVDVLEEKNPGTRHSILNSYDAIKHALIQLYPAGALSSCTRCGEPTGQTLCKACILKEKICQL